MLGHARAAARYYTEPEGPYCIHCGDYGEWDKSGTTSLCTPCANQIICDDAANYLDAPLRELAELVEQLRAEFAGYHSPEPRGTRWINWANALRAQVPEIADALEDFASQMEG